MDSPFRSARPAASLQSSPPPPLYVHYLPQGEVQNAWRSAEAPYSGRRRPRGAKRAGVVYQRRVEAWDGLASANSVECSPWFCFLDDSGGRHYCQPDLLVRVGDKLLVCEIKIRWTSDAWWQLRKLYLPVLTRALAGSVLVPVCICRSYDPSISIPDPVQICKSIQEASDPGVLNIILVQ